MDKSLLAPLVQAQGFLSVRLYGGVERNQFSLGIVQHFLPGFYYLRHVGSCDALIVAGIQASAAEASPTRG